MSYTVIAHNETVEEDDPYMHNVSGSQAIGILHELCGAPWIDTGILHTQACHPFSMSGPACRRASDRIEEMLPEKLVFVTDKIIGLGLFDESTEMDDVERWADRWIAWLRKCGGYHTVS